MLINVEVISSAEGVRIFWQIKHCAIEAKFCKQSQTKNKKKEEMALTVMRLMFFWSTSPAKKSNNEGMRCHKVSAEGSDSEPLSNRKSSTLAMLARFIVRMTWGLLNGMFSSVYKCMI